MRQTTFDEPQTEHDLICAIERLGWRRLSDEYGLTVWFRNDVYRTLPMDALPDWLAAGTPERAEPSVIDVEAVIRTHEPITRRRLRNMLKRDYDTSGLAALLDEQIADGYIEETDAGLVLVDRL